MRTGRLILLAGLVGCSNGLFAAGWPPTPDYTSRLDVLLRGWENETSGMRDIYCKFQLENLEEVFDKRTIEYGEAWGVKPHYGRLDLHDSQGNRQVFIATGKEVYHYDFQNKQIIIHKFPEGSEGQMMLPAMTFVFGMSAEQAKRKYQLQLYGEDKTHFYLRATPRMRAEKQDFKFAKLVFNKTTHFPEQMLIVLPGSKQQRWIFTRVQKNVNLTRESLRPQPAPRGWKQIINRMGDPPGQTARRGLRPAGARSQSVPRR